MATAKVINVNVLLKLLNDKRVRQAIQGITQDMKKLEAGNKTLSNTEEQVRGNFSKTNAVLTTVTSKYQKLNQQASVTSTVLDKQGKVVSQNTQALVSNKNVITEVSTK